MPGRVAADVAGADAAAGGWAPRRPPGRRAACGRRGWTCAGRCSWRQDYGRPSGPGDGVCQPRATLSAARIIGHCIGSRSQRRRLEPPGLGCWCCGSAGRPPPSARCRGRPRPGAGRSPSPPYAGWPGAPAGRARQLRHAAAEDHLAVARHPRRHQRLVDVRLHQVDHAADGEDRRPERRCPWAASPGEAQSAAPAPSVEEVVPRPSRNPASPARHARCAPSFLGHRCSIRT